MAGKLPELIQALLSPSAYAHEARDIELIQTHISYVFLVGPYAYKVKKPLELHFLDYGTLERRRLMCEEEVRLNRRLCEDVYLGVVPIVSAAGGAVHVEGEGEVLEYAVKMRRVPSDRMLPAMLTRGAVSGEEMRRVATVIAGFHRNSATDNRIAAFGSVEALRANWEENFQQSTPFVGRTVTAEQITAVREYTAAFIEANKALIVERASAGRTRDCHGDLRADSVVIGMEGAICIMDCIEFNDRIRYGDVAGDIGFLAMDLDYRGRPDLADELMSAYLNDVDDETLPCMLDFYRCYRAFVRAKVESMQLDEPEVEEEQHAAAEARARAYYALSVEYASARRRPALVIMMGLSGTGKSYVAAAVAARSGAVLLRSDTTRRRLFGEHGAGRGETDYGAGSYSDAARRGVYDELHRCAAEHLRAGRTVVLDATYGARADRAEAVRVSAAAGVRAIFLHVTADEVSVRRRLARRAAEPASVSDARWSTYLEQRKRFDPPDEVPADTLVEIDGTAPLRDSVMRVVPLLS